MIKGLQMFTPKCAHVLCVLTGLAVTASILLYSGCGMTGAPNTPARPTPDTLAPTSIITSPTAGATVSTGTTVSVTGTASDTGGGSVARVEVSVDGGASFSAAMGTTSWSFSFTPATPGQARIRSRAVDNSGNVQDPPTEITITAQDVTPPTSAITSPAPGATVSTGTAVSITGTASDAGGGTVARVEVSVDGGATFSAATGTTAWSFTWMTHATPGQVKIRSRAVDNSGNMQNPPAEITVTVRIPIRVPSEQPTIQSAIDVATDGDIVLVAPGTYFENIVFKGKAITVTSESGAEVTFIDGRNEGSVVSFISGEGGDSALNGFTVQNGNVHSGSFAGGGIVVRDSSPTITNNRIRNNRAVNDGGGIVVQNSSPTITNNMITNNNACRGSGIGVLGGSPLIQKNTITNNFNDLCVGGSGGGIFIQGRGSAEIFDNIISNNKTGAGGGINLENAEAPIIKGNIIKGNIVESQGIPPGGGIYVRGPKALIVQNVVTGNTSGYGAGVYLSIFNSAMVVNNTIVDNNAVAVSGFNTDGSGVFIENGGGVIELTNNIIIAKPGQTAYKCSTFIPPPTPTTRFNNVFSPGGPAYGGTCSNMTGTNGNISADPLFADPTQGDYHLQMGSPSIDKGDNQAQNLPDWDLDGKTRIQDGDGDGTSTIDMGVYEFVAPPGLEIGLLDQSKDNSANGRNPFICNLRPWTRSIRPKNSLSSLPARSLRLRGAR
jgi:parallel beta-helix repeat protein